MHWSVDESEEWKIYFGNEWIKPIIRWDEKHLLSWIGFNYCKNFTFAISIFAFSVGGRIHLRILMHYLIQTWKKWSTWNISQFYFCPEMKVQTRDLVTMQNTYGEQKKNEAYKNGRFAAVARWGNESDEYMGGFVSGAKNKCYMPPLAGEHNSGPRATMP